MPAAVLREESEAAERVCQVAPFCAGVGSVDADRFPAAILCIGVSAECSLQIRHMPCVMHNPV